MCRVKDSAATAKPACPRRADSEPPPATRLDLDVDVGGREKQPPAGHQQLIATENAHDPGDRLALPAHADSKAAERDAVRPEELSGDWADSRGHCVQSVSLLALEPLPLFAGDTCALDAPESGQVVSESPCDGFQSPLARYFEPNGFDMDLVFRLEETPSSSGWETLVDCEAYFSRCGISPEWANWDSQCGWALEAPPADAFGLCLAPHAERPEPFSWWLEAANVPAEQRGDARAAPSPQTPEHPAPALRGSVWRLSRNSQGCRDVQRALDEADAEGADRIADELRGHVWHAVECCNANHVLQKCISKAPGAAAFVISELVAWPDGSRYLAKHRFGCRIFERLLESFPAEDVRGLVDDVLEDAAGLCTHQFANYVMQHLFEFGAPEQRTRLVDALLQHAHRMSADHRGAAVVSKALSHGTADERELVAQALLEEPGRIAHMATQRCGHVAVICLLQMPGIKGATRRALGAHAKTLQSSRYGRMVSKALDDEEYLARLANPAAGV